MKLGLNLGYWGAGNDADNLALAQEADALGYSVVWAAEAYGSDAPTVLAWVGAQTTHIDIGSAVMQIPARSPAMAAMTAATLDTLSGGRFRMGLGVSGPQVSEGWHGVRFDKPLGRTREYVEVVNLALSRHRVKHAGVHYPLPLPDGPGKALTLTVHPVREHIPIYLASIGPKNLELTGEIADGWLSIFYSAEHAEPLLEHILAGRRKAANAATTTVDGPSTASAAKTAAEELAGFDVVATAPMVVGEDIAACAAPVRHYAALYVGGMGSREQNFYNKLATDMGFGAAAAEVQDRYLAREYDAAAAAVPEQFVDATSLLGPQGRIAERMAVLSASGVTTLNIVPFAGDLETRRATLQTAMAALGESGVQS